MAISKEQAKAMIMEKTGMSEEEFVEKEKWVTESCVCGGCPSYAAEETGLGFCWPSIGKAANITAEKGCICGGCPVYLGAELTLNYYCTRDSEIVQKMSG